MNIMRFNNKDFDKVNNMLRTFFRDVKGYKKFILKMS